MSKFTPATTIEKDLYEALLDMVDLVDEIDHVHPPEDDTWTRNEAYEKAIAALAKADGK